MVNSSSSGGDEQYFVRWRGSVSGPWSAEKLRSMLLAGKITKHHQVSIDKVDWEPLLNRQDLLAEPSAVPPAPEANVLKKTSGKRALDRWYYIKNKSTEGPVPAAELTQMVSSGRITSDSQICKEGDDQWVQLANIFPETAPASKPLKKVKKVRKTEPVEDAPVGRICLSCGCVDRGHSPFCKSCGDRLGKGRAARGRRNVDADSSDATRAALGFIGSFFLIIGVFVPIMSVPILGSINYFLNGKGDGVIILILAVVSILFTAVRWFPALFLTALGCIAVCGYTIYQFTENMNELKAGLGSSLGAEMADLAANTVQLQWGWAVLGIGIIMLLAAAVTPPSSR